MYRSLLAFSLLLLFFSSCKDDNGLDSDENLTDKERVLKLYNEEFLGTTTTDMGWTGSTGSCTPGSISAEAQNNTLKRINFFRKLAGLDANITFRTDWNNKCQEAALMCHANNQLNHFPPATWSCYTADGAEAAGRSNLSSSPATYAITSYMRDAGGGNKAVGHRRYILYSRAKTMGHGATDRYDALWVVGGAATPNNTREFIAWPPQVVPAPLVFPRWSMGAPGANFANATVTMTDEQGVIVPVDVVSKTDNFGDPTIVFEPDGIDLHTDDKKYKVKIEGATVAGVPKTFQYEVTIVMVQ